MADKLKVFAAGLLYCLGIYTVIWAPLFGVAWLIRYFNPDEIAGQIFNVFYYAGYPIYGVAYALFFVFAAFALAIAWVFKLVFITCYPYSLYSLPLFMTCYLMYMVWKRMNRN